jgi:hypothetical protein
MGLMLVASATAASAQATPTAVTRADATAGTSDATVGDAPGNGATCQAAIEVAVGRYVNSRRGALSRCHDDTERGVLDPCDCETEPRTAARLARAEQKAVRRMRRACNEESVLAPPPRGLGAAACGGSNGTCEFRFAALDDGVRGNDNDYLDCVLCLSDVEVAERIESRYAGVASDEPPRETVTCRDRLGRAAIAFTARKHRILRRCAAHGNDRGCLRPEVQERIAAVAAKLGERLLKPCAAAAALRRPSAPPNMPAA